MEGSFVICLLTASITLVFAKSQECTVCQSSGKDCQGKKEECSAPEDKCSIISMENILGRVNQSSTKKKCIHPEECDKGLAVLDLGNNQLIRGHVFCCKDDQCTFPSWPNRKIVTSNNKRCPACYTEPKEQIGCKEKMINCTGEDEIYCAEMFLQKKEGGKNITATMKGCANKAFCEKMEISTIASPFTVLLNSNCKNATGTVDTTTGSLGLFLLAQSGLLLVTIFS